MEIIQFIDSSLRGDVKQSTITSFNESTRIIVLRLNNYLLREKAGATCNIVNQLLKDNRCDEKVVCCYCQNRQVAVSLTDCTHISQLSISEDRLEAMFLTELSFIDRTRKYRQLIRQVTSLTKQRKGHLQTRRGTGIQSHNVSNVALQKILIINYADLLFSEC